jgi:hypothetical protein
MFKVSHRSKLSFKEKFVELQKIDYKTCSSCGEKAVRGRYEEPAHALIIDSSPTAEEFASGLILPEKRLTGLKSIFGLGRMDFGKFGYTYLSKSNASACLNHVNAEIELLDPLLVIAWGESVTASITGRTDIEQGKVYVTGKDNQFLFLSILHPRQFAQDKETHRATMMAHLNTIAGVAGKYALNLFK